MRYSYSRFAVIAGVVSMIVVSPVTVILNAGDVTADNQSSKNRVLTLDGNVSYLEAKRTTNVTKYNHPRTIELWFKPAAYDLRLISTGSNFQTGVPLWLLKTDPRGRLAVYHGHKYFTGKTIAKLHTWHHAAFSFDRDSTVLKLYLDGQLQFAGPVPDRENTENENIYIGSAHGGYFTGEIDEVRIWNRALNQEEINRNMFKVLGVREEDLLCYWNFDNGIPRSSGWRSKYGFLKGAVKIISSPCPSLER